VHNHTAKTTDRAKQSLGLVGNPNVGKSVVFGYFTGRYVNVSNYPGTTVEITRGRMTGEQPHWDVIDTPGVNNFIPSSEDEVVTRNILLDDNPARILQVIDAKNLRRGLLLSLQLAEMGLPFTVCLNMADEARDRGIVIDRAALAKELGVPVVDTIATQKVGLEDARQRVLDNAQPGAQIAIDYPEAIRQAADTLAALLPEASLSATSLALMLLAGDTTLHPRIKNAVDAATWELILGTIENTRSAFSRSLNVEITHARMRMATQMTNRVVQKRETRLTSLAQWLGKMAVHPIGGLAVAAVVLAGMYYFVGVFGAGTLVNLLEEGVFGQHVIPWITKAVEIIFPWQLPRDLLVGEFGILSMALSYSVAIVLPIVGTFFIAFGLLEDSGYLPRLSVMMNRAFRAMGLNGKAVLPMVLGLGCDTMATMTTRILDSRKERLIVTLLLALGVPCSAQLGVILAMLQGISLSASFLWVGLVLATLFAVGYLSSKVLPGQTSDFVLELPPLRRPIFSNIAIKTLARLEWYLREAVPLFFLGTFILFLMDKFAILVLIEEATGPVIQTMLGLPKEATAAFIMGFLRRDYGAAGLFMLARAGQLDPVQTLVSLVVITLFMPCIANFFMIIKEQGWKVALGISAFVLPFALALGGILNWTLRSLGATF